MYTQDILRSFRVPKLRDSKKSVKFMQVLDKGIFLKLKELARARGVTVQELIRVLIIPDWMRRTDDDTRRIDTRRVHQRLKTISRSVPLQVAMRADRRKQ
jgi:hypothetical protein